MKVTDNKRKVDIGCVVSRVSQKELQGLSTMLRSVGVNSDSLQTVAPTHVIDIYKNRRGGLRGVRIWTKIDLGTGERKDICITREDNTPYSLEEFNGTILRTYKPVPIKGWKENLNGE